MADTHHQITLPAELESLAHFRDHIRATCNNISSLDEQAIYDVTLAVDEICTNIIIHGYAGMDPGSIILNVEVTPQALVVTISDFGHAFEPVEPPSPDANATLEEREVGGLGLFFVFSSVDDIQYESSPFGNSTRLIKKLVR
jgi:serine/threonine-protein kinase RsbW